MAVTPLPPLAVLLLHLGACREAIVWAGRRPISQATLRACPSDDWRAWLALRCKVSVLAAWPVWERGISCALAGAGFGDGYGFGDGDGYGAGAGFGAGFGDGFGDGDGDGDGAGAGYGDGYGYGYGDER